MLISLRLISTQTTLRTHLPTAAECTHLPTLPGCTYLPTAAEIDVSQLSAILGQSDDTGIGQFRAATEVDDL